MGEQVVEFAGALADQMGEHLALLLARQIGAGRGRRQIELRRIAGMLGHVVRPSFSLAEFTPSIARRAAGVKAHYRAGGAAQRGRAPDY